jgi:hypothetical protein
VRVGDARGAGDRVGHGRGGAVDGRDHVGVAHHLGAAAERAGHRGAHHARLRAHVGEQARGLGRRAREQLAVAARAHERRALRHLLGGLRAEALERGEPPVGGRGLERGERVDA